MYTCLHISVLIQVFFCFSKSSRGKGYCFITFADAESLCNLLPLLWQQSIPTRNFRPLKLLPLSVDDDEDEDEDEAAVGSELLTWQ